MRLVSLLPSATEIVYALGLGADLVGVTFECDEPAAARLDKAVVVGGRDTSGMSPAEIDGYVRAQLAAGADLYTLRDADAALARLRPDLILTQDLCRVCALPAGHVTEALDYLGCQADVLSLDPNRVEAVLGSIRAVGRRTGTADRAARLVADLRGRLAAVAARVARSRDRRPKVAVIEWVDPPFSAGHWIPDLVSAAGGEPVAARPGRRSEPLTWQEVAAAGPDLILVAPCGYHLAGAVSQARTVTAALPGVPVWAIDADSLVVRPGPRLVDGVEAIAAILHPDAVAPRRRGPGEVSPASRRREAERDRARAKEPVLSGVVRLPCIRLAAQRSRRNHEEEMLRGASVAAGCAGPSTTAVPAPPSQVTCARDEAAPPSQPPQVTGAAARWPGSRAT